MPISFYLMVAAAAVFRLPAWEAERRLRQGPPSLAPDPPRHRTAQRQAFLFNTAACSVLLLALWQLPDWGLSQGDLSLLRYGGTSLVGVALLADSWALWRRSRS